MSSPRETICLNSNGGASILSSSQSSSTPTTSTSPTEGHNQSPTKTSPYSTQTLSITIENHRPLSTESSIQSTSSPTTPTSTKNDNPPTPGRNFSLAPSHTQLPIQSQTLPQSMEAPTPLPIAYIPSNGTSMPLIYVPSNRHRGDPTIELLELQLATGHSCEAKKRKWNTKLKVIGIAFSCVMVGLTCVGLWYQISKKG